MIFLFPRWDMWIPWWVFHHVSLILLPYLHLWIYNNLTHQRRFFPTKDIQSPHIDTHLSKEKKPGCLGYGGDYTTQLYREYNKPL